MAIVIEQAIATAVDTPSGSASSASITPLANELLLCLISIRGGGPPATAVSGVSGNGLTWVMVREEDDTQNAICATVYRAMGASPSAGAVTVNFNVDPVAVNFQVLRISGVITSGTNGSGAIGDIDGADTGATDTATPTITLTTTAANSMVIGHGTGRGRTWANGGTLMPILLNQTANSGGNIVRSNTEYQDVAAIGNATVDFTISEANDWVLIALELLADPGSPPEPPEPPQPPVVFESIVGLPQPRGTIYSQNNLSYRVDSPPWRSVNVREDLMQEVISYDHSSTALGGFWTANLGLRLPLNRIEDWINNGVGRQVTVFGRARTIAWEGIVNRITFSVGGYDMTIGPFLEIANKIKLSYSIFLQLGGGNATGLRVSSDYIQDTVSQSKYGILEKNFGAGGISAESVTDLQAMLLERFKTPARSENLTLPGETGLNYFDIKLECIGYVYMFQRYLYNSATAGLQNLSTKIAAIIAAEPNNLFTSIISTNTMQVPAFENDDAEAWGLLKALTAMGGITQERYTFGCYDDRQIVYKPVSNSAVYIRPLREGASVIQDAQGGLLQPWEVRPGVYVLVTDLLVGKPVASVLEDDSRILFAETVQFRWPNNLIINGAHSFRVEQKMAQLGISGLS